MDGTGWAEVQEDLYPPRMRMREREGHSVACKKGWGGTQEGSETLLRTRQGWSLGPGTPTLWDPLSTLGQRAKAGPRARLAYQVP